MSPIDTAALAERIMEWDTNVGSVVHRIKAELDWALGPVLERLEAAEIFRVSDRQREVEDMARRMFEGAVARMLAQYREVQAPRSLAGTAMDVAEAFVAEREARRRGQE